MTPTDGLRALFGSTAGAVSELTAADRVISTALPLSRRVGVVSLHGGSGTTTVASTLAGVIGRRRAGPVLAVDAAGGAAGLARRFDGSAAPDLAAAAVRATARSLTQARAGLAVTETAVSLLDLAQPGRRPASAADWRAQVSPVARFFDLVVTDWGVRPTAMDLVDVATTGHVLVVVARADRHAAAAASGAVEALLAATTQSSPVLVLVDVARTADHVAVGLRRWLGVPVQLLPYDRHEPDDPGHKLSGRSRLARIRLAAAVLAAAIESRESTSPSTSLATSPSTSLATSSVPQVVAP